MRLFTGLDLPGDVETRLDRLLAELRPTAPIQWSPLENLHITTKFIGDFPEGRLAELVAALKAIPKPGPLSVAIRGVGWFPNPHQARVLFAAVDAPPGLQKLANATDAACASLGVPNETKPYSPHLTLARIRGAENLTPVRQAIARRESLDFGAFTASSFFLYRSGRSADHRGSAYTKLSEFSLA